jgi:hypothetical protein
VGIKAARWAITMLVGGLVLAAAPTASAHDVLPDLGMAKVVDLQQTSISDGRTLLRYSTTIVNVGAGAFEVHGARTSPSEMSQTQRIFDSTGTFRDVMTPGTMVFGGDGHNHWHVNNLATSELIALNGNKVGTSNKRGFCFWDNIKYRLTLLGAPRNPMYQSTGCGTLDSNTVAMGLSVGWGDEYAATLPDQYIDITNVALGRYRLQVSADSQNWFAEVNETNNVTWVDLQLRKQGQPKILGYGPVA